MSLQALVLCSDDKIIRVLRRVLSDLEIGVELCTDADSSVRKLTRRRFEAVVVDCNDEDMAAQVLKSVRSAPCNKRSIAVAMIDGKRPCAALLLSARISFSTNPSSRNVREPVFALPAL